MKIGSAAVARDLGRAVKTLHANQRVSQCELKADDANAAPFKASRPSHAPLLQERIVGISGAQRAEPDGARGKRHIERQSQTFTLRRHLPAYVVGLAVQLAQFQVGGARLVRHGFDRGQG